MNRTILLTVTFASLALAGCASRGPIGQSPQVTVTDLTTLPVPEQPTTLKFQSLDSIEIRVLQDETLNGTYVVDENGNINFPYIGKIAAASRSPTQVADEVARRLKGSYVVDPQVTIRPTAIPVPSVSLGGEVEAPGNYPHSGSATLLRAVNSAGGRSEYAKLSEVLVFRTDAGKHYIGVYDLGAIERGNYPDPKLFPGDIVMVGDSPFRRRLAGVLSVLPLLTTSAILIDRLGN